MTTSPIRGSDGNGLSSGDKLAIDRTFLANQQTLLAYLRTGVAVLITGVLSLLFLPPIWSWVVGIACMGSGITIGIIGAVRYRRMNRSLALVQKQFGLDVSSTAGIDHAPQG